MTDTNVVILASSILACSVVGFLTGFTAANNEWEKEVIKRGYAQHNPITAKFEWKEYDCKFKGDKE